ncbi:MAG: hypothetical protein QE285_04910 [Aquabacterium sp.]|nr:hypothetical protein [Aquabacterium sp.]
MREALCADGRAPDRLEDKRKASQKEALPDGLGMVRGLQEHACDAARAMAALIQGASDGEGPRSA